MKTQGRANARRCSTKNDGVSLVLVMLTMLLLSALGAALVFLARSETFASYSYKMDTEADYVAKAGIQQAMNWFRSSHYQAVSNSQATTYYNVTSDGSIYNLYTSNTTPVQCKSSSSTQCPAQNSAVQLITYGSASGNFPGDLNNNLGSLVTTDFQNSLKDVTITGNSGNIGHFCVNAYLLNYQTVNCTSCAVNPAPMETWLVTSKGSWGGTSCTSGVIATAEEQAIIQPVYTSSWGNALYGYCGVTMSGSSGVCTDAFNSALGAYGGGNPSVASGACDSSSSNVIDSGAGVGGNGYVKLGSNVEVSGNVTIGNVGYTPPSSCCTSTSNPACGYTGASSSVQGTVLNAPPAPVPAAPTFPTGSPVNYPTGPAAAQSYNTTVNLPQTSSGNSTAPSGPINPGANGFGWPCMTSAVCNGSSTSPYLIKDLTPNGSDVITLYGGPDIGHPVYYDIDTINTTGNATIAINGFVVLNVRTSLAIAGNGVANAASMPPEKLQINYAGTSAATLGGNGGISGLVTAPLATVQMGGGGSSGYFIGAVKASYVSDQGGYPVHYDVQLNRVEGTMGQIVISSYSRIKR